jgi:hypothetical protein
VGYRKLSDKWRDAEAATLAGLATLAASKAQSANLLGGNQSQISEQQPRSSVVKESEPEKTVREVSEAGQADFHFRAGTPAKVAKLAKHERTLAGGATLAAPQARESQPAIPPGDPLSAALWSLETCPAYVPEARWRQAIEDGQRFIDEWRNQALALRWTARDLFGLHTPPEEPHPSYRRLSRYDETGLIWLLEGREVVALTTDTAVIRWPSGSVTTYRKSKKPAFGPFGDSLDDFQ